MGILVVLVVKMLDPIVILLSVTGGLISRRWWHVAVAAGVVGFIVEVLFTGLVAGRPFNPLVLVLGIAGAGIWASLAFLARTRWFKRTKSN